MILTSIGALMLLFDEVNVILCHYFNTLQLNLLAYVFIISKITIL